MIRHPMHIKVEMKSLNTSLLHYTNLRELHCKRPTFCATCGVTKLRSVDVVASSTTSEEFERYMYRLDTENRGHLDCSNTWLIW